MTGRMRTVAWLALACSLAAPATGQEIDEELAAEGERVFRQCQACHQVGDGAQIRVGPHLNDVIGRQAGELEGFRYSPAMVQAGEEGLVWDEEALDAYLENPRAHVPGTSMAFAGLRQEGQREAVIEFLKTHSSDEDEDDGNDDEDEDDEA
jgi:cytochrome c2